MRAYAEKDGVEPGFMPMPTGSRYQQLIALVARRGNIWPRGFSAQIGSSDELVVVGDITPPPIPPSPHSAASSPV